MKKIAYISKVGKNTYNIYSSDGMIIGGQVLPGECQSMTTNGDTYTITILDNNLITSYTYDINNVLQNCMTLPAPKKENEKIVDKNISKPFSSRVANKDDVIIKTPGAVSYVSCAPYFNSLNNNLSRLFHFINGICLIFLSIFFSALTIDPINIFTGGCFIYSFLFYGYCVDKPFFNLRTKIYKWNCILIVFIICLRYFL